MEPSQLFTTILHQTGDCVARVNDSQLGNATPCTDWDLKALLNHMVYELLWVPDMLAGKTVAEVGDKYEGDVLGETFHEAWQNAATAAAEAVNKADPAAIVHLSYADKPAHEYITEVAADILVHAWDADQAVSCSLRFDESLVRAVYDYLAPRIEGYRQSGAVADAVPVADDAPLLHKLLGMMGRSPVAS